MPTHTLNIPAQTLPIGLTTFGPMNVGNNSHGEIVLDRTIPGGLNSLTAASTVDVQIQSSPDGTVWNGEGGAVWVGGQYTSVMRGPVNTAVVTVDGMNIDARRVRILATVAGPAGVPIVGTVTVA